MAIDWQTLIRSWSWCSSKGKLVNTGAADFTLPNDFSVQEFEAVYKKLQAHSQQKHEYDLGIGAMHAISYRFKALAEYDDRFTASIASHGPAPAQPIRYEQERDLFGFFSNAFSVFDTLCFVLFAIGALTGAPNFSLATAKDERNVNWATMKKAYNTSYPSDPILATINTIEADAAFTEIRDARNMFTHRATPPRHHKLAIGSPSPNETTIARVNIVVDATTTASRRRDVARLLQSGLQAAANFVAVRL
jgi:hypothetical protein